MATGRHNDSPACSPDSEQTTIRAGCAATRAARRPRLVATRSVRETGAPVLGTNRVTIVRFAALARMRRPWGVRRRRNDAVPAALTVWRPEAITMISVLVLRA